MAKAYIANKPVRFDRNYKVGEVIPDGVISPQMGRRLMEMGRILCVDLPNAPASTEPPQEGAQQPTGGATSEGEVNTQGKAADAPEGESDPPEGKREATDIPVGSTGDTKGSENDPQGGAEPPEDGAEPPQKGADETDKANTQGETADAPEGKPDGQEGKLTAADLINGTAGEFVCEVCGRTFQSQQGLAAHSRSHKE